MKIKRRILAIGLMVVSSVSLIAINNAVKNEKLYKEQIELTEKQKENNEALRNNIDELILKIEGLEQENYQLRNQ